MYSFSFRDLWWEFYARKIFQEEKYDAFKKSNQKFNSLIKAKISKNSNHYSKKHQKMFNKIAFKRMQAK